MGTARVWCGPIAAATIAAWLAPVQAPAAPVSARGVGDPVAYFGGYDETTGLARPEGIWTFDLGPGETDPLQGWTSRDLTDEGEWVRHVTSSEFSGDPVDGTITAGGSTASLWWGVHTDEAFDMAWTGGMGYGNHWDQFARRSFSYAGAGAVTIEFDYFTDTETSFDFTYVYVVTGGVSSPPLNESEWGNPDGKGYSGSFLEGTNIGTPGMPAHDVIVVGTQHLPEEPGPFEVVFLFESDPLSSDEDTGATSGLFGSTYGAFGLDNVHVTGVALEELSTFEGGEDGWTLGSVPAAGAFLSTAAYDGLNHRGLSDCPLGGNVMLAADLGPAAIRHPQGQRELLLSPPAYVGGHPDKPIKQAHLSLLADQPVDDGVAFQVSMHYYPWVNPLTLESGWTIQPATASSGYSFLDPPACLRSRIDNTSAMPASVDSIRLVIEILADCTAFGIPDCPAPEGPNATPYFDDVQLVLLSDPAVAVPGAVGVTATRLVSASPNPFNPTTRVTFDLAEAAAPELRIFDAAGRSVRVLAPGPRAAGRHALEWDGTDDGGRSVASGVYRVELQVQGSAAGGLRLVLLK